jgi:hypothetical protein
MTPSTAESLLKICDLLASTIERDAVEPVKAEPPRKPLTPHAITFVWNQGDRPRDAKIISTCPDRVEAMVFVAHAIAERGITSTRDPSPSPDATQAMAALVRVLAREAYLSEPSGTYRHQKYGHANDTISELISAICGSHRCPISPAEVAAILGETL